MMTYKFLRGNIFSSIDIDVAKERWDRAGLMEDVRNRDNMAIVLEATAIYLNSDINNGRYDEDEACVILFPIMYRIFKDYAIPMSQDEICNKVPEICEDVRYKWLNGDARRHPEYPSIDIESEFACHYVTEYKLLHNGGI
jgi:hypothetical protein